MILSVDLADNIVKCCGVEPEFYERCNGYNLENVTNLISNLLVQQAPQQQSLGFVDFYGMTAAP